MTRLPKCFQNPSDYDPHYCAECTQERDCYKRWIKKLKKESEETPKKVWLAFEHGFVAQSCNVDKDGSGYSMFLPEYTPHKFVDCDTIVEWIKTQKNISKEKIIDFINNF